MVRECRKCQHLIHQNNTWYCEAKECDYLKEECKADDINISHGDWEKLIELAINMYQKGWKDGAEAASYHIELLKEEQEFAT